ncbi:MAG: ExbD/TolR family protein [Sandaracinaceae bacterium]
MNVTPLVDVVLVLLIIFMIVIPAMEESLDLQVPAITHPDDEREGEPEPLMLAITQAGSVYLQEQPVRDGELSRLLEHAHARRPRARLVLRGDREVPYREVRALFTTASSIGFPGVSLRVNHLEGAEPDGDD